jgi:hypothetical protein
VFFQLVYRQGSVMYCVFRNKNFDSSFLLVVEAYGQVQGNIEKSNNIVIYFL